jgi:hypothetical protein
MPGTTPSAKDAAVAAPVKASVAQSSEAPNLPIMKTPMSPAVDFGSMGAESSAAAVAQHFVFDGKTAGATRPTAYASAVQTETMMAGAKPVAAHLAADHDKFTEMGAQAGKGIATHAAATHSVKTHVANGAPLSILPKVAHAPRNNAKNILATAPAASPAALSYAAESGVAPSFPAGLPGAGQTNAENADAAATASAPNASEADVMFANKIGKQTGTDPSKSLAAASRWNNFGMGPT